MDEATLARATEPFFSTKGVGQGTGLGLSSVHGLVAQLHGSLEVKSQLGVGTTIELWLPESDVAFEEPSASEREPPALRLGVVLLVDDQKHVRVCTAHMLKELGYTVREASSAEEALTIMESEEAVDLVLTDHLMPGMKGGDLAKLLRQRLPELPVLLVSGYAEEDSALTDLPRLTKPFHIGELAASLAKLALRFTSGSPR
jgi:CheY-like chemotaxis protein